MSKTDIDTKKLRELAEAATPGPWEYVPPEQGNGGRDFIRYAGNGSCVADFGAYPPWRADAAFIAAANPTTVLELLDEIERLRGVGRQHEEWCRMFGSGWIEGTPEAALAEMNERLAAVTAALNEACDMLSRSRPTGQIVGNTWLARIAALRAVGGGK